MWAQRVSVRIVTHAATDGEFRHVMMMKTADRAVVSRQLAYIHCSPPARAVYQMPMGCLGMSETRGMPRALRTPSWLSTWMRAISHRFDVIQKTRTPHGTPPVHDREPH